MAADTPIVGDLCSEPDLLYRFENDVELAGLVGEKKNAKIVLLVAVSAKLQSPLNISVGGTSSAGKNYLTGTVARFIPEQDKKILTGMTPKVLMHSKEDEFQHKAVFIAEYEGVAAADYAIRVLQSEREIKWEFVETSKDGIGRKGNSVKGPAAFIQATTRVTLHPENETRLLFLQMDESAQQTRAINMRQAQEAEKKSVACPADLYTKWHELLRSLQQKPVRIPFATQLAEALPERVRSRRDLPKLLGLIEVSAYLHQHRRALDQDGNIVARPEDYYIAKTLFEHCYYTGPESKVGELVKAAKELGKPEVTVFDLMMGTSWCKSKTYAVLGRAEELGNLAQGDRRGCYRLMHDHVESLLNLPAKVRLSADDFHASTAPSPENFHDSTVPRQVDGVS
ncbi:MAG: hypothetical protein JOZ36_18465 [Acidobacteria bacterium]|nr:hypothetical protein [Acidobacteriota bacterium]